MVTPEVEDKADYLMQSIDAIEQSNASLRQARLEQLALFHDVLQQSAAATNSHDMMHASSYNASCSDYLHHSVNNASCSFLHHSNTTATASSTTTLNPDEALADDLSTIGSENNDAFDMQVEEDDDGDSDIDSVDEGESPDQQLSTTLAVAVVARTQAKDLLRSSSTHSHASSRDYTAGLYQPSRDEHHDNDAAPKDHHTTTRPTQGALQRQVEEQGGTITRLLASLHDCQKSAAQLQSNADLKQQRLTLEIVYLRKALSDVRAQNDMLIIRNERLQKQWNEAVQQQGHDAAVQPTAAATAAAASDCGNNNDTTTAPLPVCITTTLRRRQNELKVEAHLNSLLLARNQAVKENYVLKRLLMQTCESCRAKLPLKRNRVGDLVPTEEAGGTTPSATTQGEAAAAATVSATPRVTYQQTAQQVLRNSLPGSSEAALLSSSSSSVITTKMDTETAASTATRPLPPLSARPKRSILKAADEPIRLKYSMKRAMEQQKLQTSDSMLAVELEHANSSCSSLVLDDDDAAAADGTTDNPMGAAGRTPPASPTRVSKPKLSCTPPASPSKKPNFVANVSIGKPPPKTATAIMGKKTPPTRPANSTTTALSFAIAATTSPPASPTRTSTKAAAAAAAMVVDGDASSNGKHASKTVTGPGAGKTADSTKKLPPPSPGATSPKRRFFGRRRSQTAAEV